MQPGIAVREENCYHNIDNLLQTEKYNFYFAEVILYFGVFS